MEERATGSMASWFLLRAKLAHPRNLADKDRTPMADTDEPLPPFADLALARRLERAEAHANARFVEARAKAFPDGGACWIEVAGTYAMFDTASSPVTQTFGLGLFDKVDPARLERIERFFLEKGAPVCHEVSPLVDPSLPILLNERGYQPFEFTSVLYRSIRRGLSLATPANKHIKVRLAREEDSALRVNISARGWGHLPELTHFIRETEMINAHLTDAVSFFAELNGAPVAIATLCVGQGVALLGGSCTVPEARRQGAQLALLESRLRYSAEQGDDLAMMCAQPGSASQRN